MESASANLRRLCPVRLAHPGRWKDTGRAEDCANLRCPCHTQKSAPVIVWGRSFTGRRPRYCWRDFPFVIAAGGCAGASPKCRPVTAGRTLVSATVGDAPLSESSEASRASHAPGTTTEGPYYRAQRGRGGASARNVAPGLIWPQASKPGMGEKGGTTLSPVGKSARGGPVPGW